MKKNIVIAPCGNKSRLFESAWLKDKSKRNFDICLLFYHEHVEHPEVYEEVDYFFHLKDFKYTMLHNLLKNIKPEWLDEYDYFFFLDDDIDIDTEGINNMFLYSKIFKASISQPALSLDSFGSWAIFKQNTACFLRYVGQIEVMAPLFNQTALKICLPTFAETRSSWGLDSVWPKLLNYAETELIIFDEIVMKHTLPVGGGELYSKLGVDPYIEWQDVTEKYQARLDNHREYGRLQKLHVKSNLPYKLYIKGVTGIKRKLLEYNLVSKAGSFKRL